MLRNKYHLGNGTINRDASRLRVVLSSASEQPVEVTDHGELAGLLDDDHSQYVHISADRTITAQHSISPINNQAPFLLGIHAQNQTVVGLKADYLNRSIIAGNGLTGGGALTSDVTLSAKADDGIDVGVSGISVDCTDLLGDGINEDAYNNFMVDCTDLLGDGITEDASNNFMVDTAFDFDWTGAHTFSSAVNLFGQTTAQHILPRYTDTYDLGSSTLLWRKGWLSELDAILFAQNTITLLGGWLLISKDEGALATDVVAADTAIDFGKAMTQNDFVLFRTALKVEYMKVGALVSGTIYNVTRDLDGSGANDWAGGTPFCVLGASGNGRIELNAYDSPRIQMLIQGAIYNAQTELIRLGDLNGNWGYSAATYGLAIGEYASGKVNMTLDPTNSLRVQTYATTQFSVTPNLLKFGSNVSAAGTTGIAIFGADQTYNGESLGAGDLLIGDNSASKANILWDKSAGQLLFRGGTTTQVYVDTDGSLKWGSGIGILDSEGIKIEVGDSYMDLNSYRFMFGANILGGIYAKVNDVEDPGMGYVYVKSNGFMANELRLYTDSTASNGPAHTWIGAVSSEYESYIQIIANKTMLESWIFIHPRDYLLIGARTYIGVKSTTALLVEQSGVKDNVLVVDTTNGRVGVNCAPSYALHLVGQFYTNVNSTTALLVKQNGVKDNVLVVDTTNGRVGVNCAPLFEGLHVSTGGINLTYSTSSYRYRIQPNSDQTNLYISYYTDQWYPNASHPTLTITYDGKVGILNSAPAEALDVTGNIKASGHINITGYINTADVIKVDNVQVVSNRYIDSKINNNPGDTYDNPTKNLISCIKATLLAHGLVAAS